MPGKIPRFYGDDLVAGTGDVTTAMLHDLAVTEGKLAASAVTNAKVKAAAGIVGSKLATNARTAFAKAYAKLDLSGSAQADVPILHTSVAITLSRVILLYTEASSADAGVAIKVGKETDDDYYYTGTSEASKAAWYEKSLTLLATDLAAGDTLVCSNAGGKTGTGEILVCAEYTVDD